jgi:RimJ/RimL family protein N-acetyltransferase
MNSSALATHRATIALRDGRVVSVRRLRSGDADAVQAFVRALSPAARRMRFFAGIRELAARQIERMIAGTDRGDVTFAALEATSLGPRIVAVAECVVIEDEGEFAVMVADDRTQQGLGRALVEMLLAHAARAGLRALGGIVLPDNEPMLALAAALGFHFLDAEDGLIRVHRSIAAAGASGWRGLARSGARHAEVALSCR